MALLPLLKGVAVENPEIGTIEVLGFEMKLSSGSKRIKELVKAALQSEQIGIIGNFAS